MIALHRFLSGRGPAPEEWSIARLCQDFRALPMEGGLLDQPYGLVVRVMALLDYARDFQTYAELQDKAPAAVKARVLGIAARSVGRAN